MARKVNAEVAPEVAGPFVGGLWRQAEKMGIGKTYKGPSYGGGSGLTSPWSGPTPPNPYATPCYTPKKERKTL